MGLWQTSQEEKDAFKFEHYIIIGRVFHEDAEELVKTSPTEAGAEEEEEEEDVAVEQEPEGTDSQSDTDAHPTPKISAAPARKKPKHKHQSVIDDRGKKYAITSNGHTTIVRACAC